MLKGFKNFKKNNPIVFNRISKKIIRFYFSDLYYGIAVSHKINSNRFLVLYYLLISIVIDYRSKTKHKFLLIIKVISFQKLNKILKLIG